MIFLIPESIPSERGIHSTDHAHLHIHRNMGTDDFDQYNAEGVGPTWVCAEREVHSLAAGANISPGAWVYH